MMMVLNEMIMIGNIIINIKYFIGRIIYIYYQ